MRIAIEVPDGPPYELRLSHDGQISITRNIAGDGQRTRLLMDPTLAQLVSDHLNDLVELAQGMNYSSE